MTPTEQFSFRTMGIKRASFLHSFQGRKQAASQAENRKDEMLKMILRHYLNIYESEKYHYG